MALGKRVRGWNMLSLAAADHRDAYARWVADAEPALVQESGVQSVHLPPQSISALILAGRSQNREAAVATRDSLIAAVGKGAPLWSDVPDLSGCHPFPSYHGQELLDALRSSLSFGAPQWLIPVKAGDRVSPWLGAVIAGNLPRNKAPIIFWDEDRLRDGKRVSPRVKPDWDPLLFQAYDGLTGVCAIDAETAIRVVQSMRIDPAADVWEALSSLVVELAGSADHPPPSHLPLILTHRASSEPLVGAEVREQLMRSTGSNPRPPAKPPLTTIVIPTRDRIDLLETCLASLARLPGPGRHEIVIVDNGSVETRTLELLYQLEQDGRARVVRQPGKFNFAALINVGVAAARGEFLCLLNNDIEALGGDWLDRMTAYARRPDVGAVGAQLLYPDGTIQHAGVALGIGGAAGHIAKGEQPRAGDFNPWYTVDREVSAVTGACLVVGRDKFLAVGGMDAEAFAVDFNDIDLCLRLRERGWRSIYCAGAVLIHHESRSRGVHRKGDDLVRFNAELAALRARWKTDEVRDPHYSTLFRRASERCLLAF
jgi:GT2 family glycosyltransferase